jgi:hypothetical protein
MHRSLFDEVRRFARPILLSAAAIALSIGSTPAIAGPSVYPTGVTIYNPQKAYNGYVVFSAPDGKTHMIDMNGNEVHRWDYYAFPAELIDPAKNGGKRGHLVVQTRNGTSFPYFGGMLDNQEVGEVDWDGNVVWRWAGPSPVSPALQNHDWARLPNGNTLLITSAIRVVGGVSDKPIDDQVIREVNPRGETVWSWAAGDHIDEFGVSAEGRDLLRKIYRDGSLGYGFLTINDMQPIGPNKWFDGGDKRFDPDNIVIDSREANFIAIIEKKTGKIVWRIGPDFNPPNQATEGYASLSSANPRPMLSLSVPRPVDQTSGQHDAHIIPKGLPGEGDLLVFDNEGPAGFPSSRLSVEVGSRILEINPVTKQIVWQYTAANSDAPEWTFFSSFISSARRLPNGNTLIDEGMNGRIFQVTSTGEIVWEYVNPYYGRESVGLYSPVRTNWVFRAQPVPYDWAPEGTKHSEVPVSPVDNANFRVGGK